MRKIEKFRERAMNHDIEGSSFLYYQLENEKRLMPSFKRYWARNCYKFFYYHSDGTLELSTFEAISRMPPKYGKISTPIKRYLIEEWGLAGYKKECISDGDGYSSIYFTKS